MTNDNYRLLFINTYLPFEGDEFTTDEFANQSNTWSTVILIVTLDLSEVEISIMIL